MWRHSMNLLAVQPYIKVIREVTSIEQTDIEEERNMYLYDDKLVTKHREFPLEDVFDISYREFGQKGNGLLYVHTIKGVFSYTVKTSTDDFINAFHKHIKQNKGD